MSIVSFLNLNNYYLKIVSSMKTYEYKEIEEKKITILTTLLKVLFYISLFLCHFAVHDADDIAGTDSGANIHR